MIDYERLSEKGNILKKALCAYTPVAQITEKAESDIAQKIIFPVIDALQNSKTPYEGFLSLKFALQKDGKITAIEFSPSISVA